VRLQSVHLQNYRVHRDLRVEFAKDLTLLHGPNESGKSTLVEAIHRVLFLKASGTTEVHKNMGSLHGGTPTVELVFEAAGGTHRLLKQFSGNNGTVTLESSGRTAISGDAAEEVLARLLGVENVLGGRGAVGAIARRWAHLWVWQGTSGESPLEAAAEARGELREQLQAKAITGISASTADNKLITTLREFRDANFTSAGKPKAGSSIQQTEEFLDKAGARIEACIETLARLESARRDFDAASSDIARHEDDKNKAETGLQAVTQKLKEVEARTQSLRDKQISRDQCAATLKALEEVDSRIHQLENDVRQMEVLAHPGVEKLEALREHLEASRAKWTSLVAEREKASVDLALARARHDALQAHVDVLKARQNMEKLQERAARITELRAEDTAAAQAASRIEGFTDKAIASLRKKQQEQDSARARLEAFALRLEILETADGVHIDGATLHPGDSRTLTAATELQVGQHTRIKLTPGGGTDLQTARQAFENASAGLQKALRSLGVDDLDPAENKALSLQQLLRERAALHEKLQALAPDEVGEARQSCSEEIARCESRRDRPFPGLAVRFCPDFAEAGKAVREAEKSWQEFAEKEQAILEEEKTAHRAAGVAAKALEEATGSHQTLAENLKGLRHRLQFEIEHAGETPLRAGKIHAARAALEEASASFAKEAAALEALQPEALRIEHERLTKAVEATGRLLSQARERRASAGSLLISAGGSDPENELKEAKAEADRATQSLAALRRRASARQLLLDRLEEARNRGAAELIRPLEEAAQPYLESLFSPGTWAKLGWAPDGSAITTFALDRGITGSGHFAFSDLSHGTREQTALILRLAMAEILAAAHDGCLPLIFDDAFTHADRERVEKLKRVLYRGAQRGLQILLFTCHPENYGGLTSGEVALPAQTL